VSEHGDRGAHFNGIVKCNRLLLWHSHATVGSWITGKIPFVQTGPTRETQEVRHRCVHEFPAWWDWHISVGVSDECPTLWIDDFAVERGPMKRVFFDNLEASRWSRMIGASTANRALQNHSLVEEQIGPLFFEIDFNRVIPGSSNSGDQ